MSNEPVVPAFAAEFPAEVVTKAIVRDVDLGPGELFVVPKGVEHRPIAVEEVHLLLIEPSGTPNTGDPATAQPRRVI